MNEVAFNSLVTYLLKCTFPFIQKQHHSPGCSGVGSRPSPQPSHGVSLELMEGIRGRGSGEKTFPRPGAQHSTFFLAVQLAAPCLWLHLFVLPVLRPRPPEGRGCEIAPCWPHSPLKLFIFFHSLSEKLLCTLSLSAFALKFTP